MSNVADFLTPDDLKKVSNLQMVARLESPKGTTGYAQDQPDSRKTNTEGLPGGQEDIGGRGATLNVLAIRCATFAIPMSRLTFIAKH